MSIPSGERPEAAFVVSLIGGLVILACSAAVMEFSPGIPYYAGMINGQYYGGMMHGYFGMMDGYYGFMGSYGSGSFYAVGAVGIVSGVVVLLGAVMIYTGSGKISMWAALILAFSVISLLSAGGFFIGAVLGAVGGILALVWKPGG